jgi:NADH dehydrogenase FAD-containing subunit
VVCGAGAAGVEMAFGFKKRWSELFKTDIKLTIVSHANTALPGAHPST